VPAQLSTELAEALQAPWFARQLQRGGTASGFGCSAGLAEPTWMAREVYGVEPPAPTAPYAWAALTGTTDRRLQVWHADPVHIAIGRDSLIVQDLADAAPDDVESEALLAAANECLRPAGCTLRKAGASWFLNADRAWAMAPPPLSSVLGQPMPLAGTGDGDPLRWSRLHNEIQMRWHENPINQARQVRGLPEVNALWLHGGGTWAPRSSLRWTRLQSARADLHGLAAASGAAVAGPDDPLIDGTLLVCDDAASAARDSDWSRWLVAMRAIDRRLDVVPQSATLELVLTGWRQVRVWFLRPSDRFRFWRRTALSQALAE
jgi:hypothetical protein